MKKLACIALLITAAGLTAGCMYGSKQNCCGEYQANCCDWSFYKPCDLIEGKRAECQPDPCAGEVIIRRAPAPDVVIEEEAPAAPAPAPAAPAPDEIEAAPAGPIGDYGMPPTGN